MLEVCTPRVVQSASFTSVLPRAFRQLLATKHLPLTLVTLLLELPLVRSTLAQYTWFLACLLMLLVILRLLWLLQTLLRFPRLHLRIISPPPLIQPRTSPRTYPLLKSIPYLPLTILRLLRIPLLPIQTYLPLLLRPSLPPILPPPTRLWLSLQTTPTLRSPQILHQHPMLLGIWLLRKDLVSQRRKSHRIRTRWPPQSEYPVQLYLRYSNDCIQYRRLCYEEWKGDNEETPDEKFEDYWKGLTQYAKRVCDIFPSHFVSSHASTPQSEIHQEGERTRTSLLLPLLTLPF